MKKDSSKKPQEITEYDNEETISMIDINKPLKLSDLGLKLPDVPPTQVISIRLPSELSLIHISEPTRPY